ncbi:uncharacterized protein L969DRAFT_85243 [Mixia osmundae IAM 14324]|uniref:Rho-GAP domain-containing protein n=1 Tax=Mixia osmundae (strain CBS 9802 / IAM 14324 / JCM 22182 / KY 12970) TaxID=764103 RepID=G7DY94_MIXOS|nr:uncharacterized protein L969DRAFT_85243 [Mixia osmundae IAM 14324]KEI41457.1 hypothetical protein L969DRAFT_85243 [Mixia osmundae IAM 14324]GAA95554.1 hypothetical protein E5Q_02209 [Mixia osmundae IAM 14324]
MVGAHVHLPPSFLNSFWTQDYTTGVETLFSKLRAGVGENDEILALVKARATLHHELAAHFGQTATRALDSRGFGYDDGANLKLCYQALLDDTDVQSRMHEKLALELEKMVVFPFERWSEGHAERITKLYNDIHFDLSIYTQRLATLESVRAKYDKQWQIANDFDDDARFQPGRDGSVSPEKRDTPIAGEGVAGLARMLSRRVGGISRQANGSSPSQASPIHPSVGPTQPDRWDSVRLQASNALNKLSEVAEAATGESAVDTQSTASESSTAVESASGSEDTTLTETPKLVKGKERAIESPMTPEGMPLQKKLDFKRDFNRKAKPAQSPEKAKPALPERVEIAGVIKTTAEWSVIFADAAANCPSTSHRVPLLGTYEHVHTGDDLVSWFQKTLSGLQGNYDETIRFCTQLTEALGVLRLVGAFGNAFYDADDAFYQWRSDAFNLSGTETDLPFDPPGQQSFASPAIDNAASSVSTEATNNGLTRSNTLAGKLSSAISGVVTPSKAGDRLSKAHRAADEAERTYRAHLRKLDDARLQLEETISYSYIAAQRCELERLKAVKTVLNTFNATLSTIAPTDEAATAKSKLLQEAFLPEVELAAIIEQHKTGPFRPTAHTFEDRYHDEIADNFGMSLIRWTEVSQIMSSQTGDIPPVLSALLARLAEGYKTLPNDKERRKVWLYEVPLMPVHRLRAILNDASLEPDVSAIATFDLPVVCATCKLWLLELHEPVVSHYLFDDVKSVYPAVGADTVDDAALRAEKIRHLLVKLPKTNLLVLDALIDHLATLIEATDSDNDDHDAYLTKLGLSVGRTLLRPKVEGAASLDDRTSARLLIDLLKQQKTILPEAIAIRTTRDREQHKPKRRRTRPTDQRIRRSLLGHGSFVDTEEDASNVASPATFEPKRKDTGDTIRPQQEQDASVPDTLAPPVLASQVTSPASSSTSSSSTEFVDALAPQTSPPPAEAMPLPPPVAEKVTLAQVSAEDLDRPLSSSSSLKRSSMIRTTPLTVDGKASPRARGPRVGGPRVAPNSASVSDKIKQLEQRD